MTHVLDRPAWNALATVHRNFAEGLPLARRYQPSVVPFAAAVDDTPESLAALAALPGNSDVMVLVEAGRITVPLALETVMEATLVQMLAGGVPDRVEDPRIHALTEADAPDMLELASLTRPGPFTLKAQSLGTFWGIRLDGRLVAMAGQRMRQPGFTELSGLCTHPDFQGRGLGKLMFRFAAGEIAAHGDQVYLHAYRDNTGAIALYRSMGFSIRCEMAMKVVKRPD